MGLLAGLLISTSVVSVPATGSDVIVGEAEVCMWVGDELRTGLSGGVKRLIVREYRGQGKLLDLGLVPRTSVKLKYTLKRFTSSKSTRHDSRQRGVVYRVYELLYRE